MKRSYFNNWIAIKRSFGGHCKSVLLTTKETELFKRGILFALLKPELLSLILHYTHSEVLYSCISFLEVKLLMHCNFKCLFVFKIYNYFIKFRNIFFNFLLISLNVKPIVAKANFEINNHLGLFTQVTSFKSYWYFWRRQFNFLASKMKWKY